MKRFRILSVVILLYIGNVAFAGNDTLRTIKYSSRPLKAAMDWQDNTRHGLYALLKLDELPPGRDRIALIPKELSSEDKGAYLLKEVEINSTPGRRIRVIVTFLKNAKGAWPAVVCIHGHGSEIQSVYETVSIYKEFDAALSTRIVVTFAPHVSQYLVIVRGLQL